MSGHAPEAPRLFPTLRFADPDGVIRWLKNVAGFVEHAVHRDGEGSIVHAEVALGSSILMLGQTRDDAYGALVGEGRRTDALYAAVPDVDAVHARAVAAGSRLELTLRDTEY